MKARTAGYTAMDNLDSEEHYAVDSEEESEEEREVVQEAPVVSEEREEVMGWEQEEFGEAQWEERELQTQLD